MGFLSVDGLIKVFNGNTLKLMQIASTVSLGLQRPTQLAENKHF
jgi:hypothetical protein